MWKYKRSAPFPFPYKKLYKGPRDLSNFYE